MQTKSVSGKTIRLPYERWVHIVEGHPEMAGYMQEVLYAVAVPDFIVKGDNEELLAALFHREDKLLVVVYKETGIDGFIVTAFFTKQIEKFLKRKMVWKKK